MEQRTASALMTFLLDPSLENRQQAIAAGVEERALTVSGDGAGLVPTEFSDKLIRLVDESTAVWRLFKHVTMRRDVMSIPHRASGPTASWTGEAQQIAESNADYNAVTLQAAKLTVLSLMSDEYLSDAIVDALEQATLEGAQAISDALDSAGLVGDGSATFGGHTGILNALDATALSAGGGNIEAGLIDIDDLLALRGSLPNYVASEGGPSWLCHPSAVYSVFHRLAVTLGGSSVADISRPAKPVFLGMPIVTSNHFPKGDSPDEAVVACGNFKQSSFLGIRSDISMKLLDQTFAQTGEIGIMLTARYALNPTVHLPSVQLLKTAAS